MKGRYQQLFTSLLAILLILLPGVPVRAQAPPLSPAAQAVRLQVQQIPIGGKLTVILPTGQEYYGNLRSIDPDSFTIREADGPGVRTLQYDEVSKVLKDYGRRGFAGRRVHPHRSRNTFLIATAALLILVFVAVAADKS